MQQQHLLRGDDTGNVTRIIHHSGTTVLPDNQGSGVPYEDDYEVALREQRLMDDESRALGRERMELSRSLSGSTNSQERNARTRVHRKGTDSTPVAFDDLPPR